MEKAEERTPPEIAAILHIMVNKLPKKDQRKCVDGDHITPSAQNPFQTPRQRDQKTRTAIDKTSWKETIVPQDHNSLCHMTFWTDFLSTIKKKKTGRRV